MNKYDAVAMLRQLMDQHGLNDWSHGLHTSQRTLGVCFSKTKRITLSEAYVRCNSEQHVRGTILHEIAHALTPDCKNHGKEWEQACRRIGGHPSARCNDAVHPPGKWQAICPSCSGRFHRDSKPRRPLACAGCGKNGRLHFERR